MGRVDSNQGFLNLTGAEVQVELLSPGLPRASGICVFQSSAFLAWFGTGPGGAALWVRLLSPWASAAPREPLLPSAMWRVWK